MQNAAGATHARTRLRLMRSEELPERRQTKLAMSLDRNGRIRSRLLPMWQEPRKTGPTKLAMSLARSGSRQTKLLLTPHKLHRTKQPKPRTGSLLQEAGDALGNAYQGVETVTFKQ